MATWRPSWISDRQDFISFRSRSRPVAAKQVLAQIDKSFGKRCRKLIFKMAAVAAILYFRSAQFQLFLVCSAPRCSSPSFNSIESRFKRRCSKYEFSTSFPYKCIGAHSNTWGSKFDLAVKRSNVSVGPSF